MGIHTIIISDDTGGTRDFSDITISNTNAQIVKTGTSDGKQGMVYLHQDQNTSSGTITGAKMKLSSQLGGGHGF